MTTPTPDVPEPEKRPAREESPSDQLGRAAGAVLGANRGGQAGTFQPIIKALRRLLRR